MIEKLTGLIIAIGVFWIAATSAQESGTLLRPSQVFDGEQLHSGWVVVTEGNKITYAGPQGNLPGPWPDTVIDLQGRTLLPGLIEGHSHVLFASIQ